MLTLALPALLLGQVSQPAKPAELLTPLGFYSNEKSSDGEHSGGFTLFVWNSSKGLYILVWVHEGLIGSGSRVKAEDIVFDRSTNKLSFKAEDSSGKYFTFSGVLTKGQAKGTFSFPSGYVRKNELMKRCCEDAKKYRPYTSVLALEQDWLHD